MDIVCVVLGIIDLFKPSMVLSIVAVCIGIVETVLLSAFHKKNKTFYWTSYLMAIFCVIVGTIKICVL